MKRKLLSRHPSPAMVVALIALCSSLVAGATAATLITSKDIKRNAVRSKHVKNRSLAAKDFRRGLLGGGAATAVKMGRAGAKNFTTINADSRTEVASLSINAPAAGFVSLSYSTTIGNATPGTWIDVFLLEDGDRINGSDEWWDPGDNDGNWDQTQGNHLVVPVTKGAHTYSLELKMNAGSSQSHDARITALFVPKSL